MSFLELPKLGFWLCEDSLVTVTRIVLISRRRFLCGLLLFTFAQRISVAQSKPEEVVFSSVDGICMDFFGSPPGMALSRQSCGIMVVRNCRALSQSWPSSTLRILTSSLFRIAEDKAARREITFRI